jgi:hypothetical protein
MLGFELMKTITAQGPITTEELRQMAASRTWELVNLRPSLGNRSRGVDDPSLRERITHLVARLVRD